MKTLIVLTLLSILVPKQNHAAPVSLQGLSRNELIAQSDFIFSGWPSSQPPAFSCAHEIGRWQVHKVLRGDPSLENKIISIAEHGYKKSATHFYKTKKLDREQSTSILFTNRQKYGCFVLSAQGAQESRFVEAEIQALLASPKDCDTTLRGFQMRADTLPRDCKQDSDCQAFSIHPKPCERPVALNKIAASKIKEEEFVTLQNRARIACADPVDKQIPCSPLFIPVRCKSNKCEEGRPAGVPPPKFTTATVRSGCAPHDALSVMIALTQDEKEFPVFMVNWWGENKPSLSGGSFALASSEGDQYAQGFQATLCEVKGHCSPVKGLLLKLRIKPGRLTGTLEFSFTNQDHEKIKGQVPVKIESQGRVLCG